MVTRNRCCRHYASSVTEYGLPLLIYPDQRLQLVCDKIELDTVRDLEACGDLLDSMWQTLDQYHGWGLAAPQIGSPSRAIVVHVQKNGHSGCAIEIVNPVLEPLKRHGKFLSKEGCLSWPGKTVAVLRYKRVKVHGYDRYGDPITYGGKDDQAACLQHEIEHLEGINLADHSTG